MGVKLLESLSMQTGLPIDDREIVQNIGQRNNIEPTLRYIGMEVFVVDENKKYRLEKGIENFNWIDKDTIKSSDLVTDSDHLTVTQTEKDKWSGKAERVHTHTKADITDFPTSLKNPNALTIKLNGTSQGAYDGSSAKEINITAENVGAQPKGNYAPTSHTHLATQITQDTNNRFTSDAEKTKWNSKADGVHTHTKGQITDFPTTMPNPHSLIIQANGSSLGDYNGSASKTFNITASNIGAYTKGEVDDKLNGKANTSHGTHIPSPQSANNKVYLRNDNTWHTITPQEIGAQPAGSYAAGNHNHDSVYQKKGDYATTNHTHQDLSQSISEINSFFDLYSLNKKYIKIDGDNSVKVLKNTIIKVGEKVFKLNNDVVLNSSNLDTGSFTIGKDYYIYCCNQENKAIFKISLNSTYPNGFNSDNSRKVGGFHYGDCRRIKSDTLEPINNSGQVCGTNWEDNIYQGILPFSVWTLLFRPISEPEGMVYSESLNKWVDIYLTSTNYLSEYNATPITGSEGIMYYDWYEKIARKTKKFPLSYAEFCCIADGSPNGRDDNNNYAWSKNDNTGRNKTGIIAKAVSSIGCKDCAGNVWEVGSSESFSTQTFGQGSWGWKNKNEIKKGAIWSAFNNDIDISLHGGYWSDGSCCGSRTLHCGYYPWYVDSHVGCRLACDSL